MGDDMKSAYELAMEKLARQSGSEGEQEAPQALTEEQKLAIADIRQEYRAKLAEREILFQSHRPGVSADPEALERLEADYRRDRDHLETRREKRVQAVRDGEKL